ncbi:chemotaxis protein CheB [Pelobacter seleniigenes]|uniref:chemotaxis protein CheB n=1 Tax=Pelobacter seleniigenes TaxID=407188 RepID=UPI0004A71B09|nr:chemotaxis protein CheB [Pelobacter seleniigenes]
MNKKPNSLSNGKEPAASRYPAGITETKARYGAVVGIGTSAGGLEALEQFLRNVPAKSGIAFVIVQHLDPTHKGVLPDLLQRVTSMTVRQVTDRMKVESDCVYIIPPNKDMSILHGVLYLFEPTESRGLRLPIDFFFNSLAEDQKQLAVGVVLSGMGSDGTLGLRAIKAKAGLVGVQDPSSAKFDSMPRSAIDAGLADIVSPAEELPGKILAYLRHIPNRSSSQPVLLEKEQSALEKVTVLLRSKTGHDFSLYKKNTLYRRIERRMAVHQIKRIDDYVRFLRENPAEAEILFKELLIGVTSFFRDPEEWNLLRDKALPALLTQQPDGGSFRAWSVGCSTGEEAYSLAITFKEAVAHCKTNDSYTLQIFATDLDQDAIVRARQGLYPVNIAGQVSDERLHRFFIQEEKGYRVHKEIREMVTFATQNIIMDPPFTKLDILLCRNLLIYLQPDLQKKLLPLFHYSLKPGGLLLLGTAETVGSFNSLFAAMQPKSRLYLRQDSLPSPASLIFPTMNGAGMPGIKKESKMPHQPDNLQSLTDQLLLQSYSPPAVLTSAQGDILYIRGKTGKYLEPASGKVNWNIFAMARDELRFEMNGAFQKAVREQKTVTAKGLKVSVNGGLQALNLTIQPITHPEALSGMVLVIFQDMPADPTKAGTGRGKTKSPASARIAELEQALMQSREELQITHESIQASQEEFKSMNEELQSTNEELQSTNEELSTSKEEMQSINEELQTVNAEQAAKMEEFGRINSDMQNLLNSTEIISLFLDNELRIKRFTPSAVKLFNLLDSDIGRPLTDLSSELYYPQMFDDAREVLRTMLFCEKQISATKDRYFSVRIMPYRTLENRIDGVVMTLNDISRSTLLEADLKATSGMLRALVQAAPLIIIGLSEEGKILEFNPEAERLLGRKRTEVIGGNFFEIFTPEVDQPKAEADLKKLLTSESGQKFTTRILTKDNSSVRIQWTAEKILMADNQTSGMVAFGQNLS